MTSSVLMMIAMTTTAINPIDEILLRDWKKHDIQPSGICSDDEFLRRVSLDLIGRIPTVDELHAFRNDRDRPAQISRLLESPEFSRFQAEIWTSILIGYAEEAEELASRRILSSWLASAIERRVPWDDVTRNLISAEGQSAFDGPVNFLLHNRDSPAVRISRVFLGVRLDCAQCHDHPHDRWTQSDFEHMARFFDVMEFDEQSESNIILRNAVPDTEEDNRPRFLTGARPRTSRWRDELALYTIRSRPFARAFANRVWYQLFGQGIVHPVDDFSQLNPPVNSELLEHLATTARDSEFDLRRFLSYICGSNAYQRTSANSPAGRSAIERFAVRKLRPLSSQQYVSSVGVATSRIFDEVERSELLAGLVSSDSDDPFAATWEYRESVQQLITQLAASTPIVAGSTPGLFNKILSRQPTARETQLCAGRSKSDIVFALLHSDEFRFSH